jgi:hypothetical protein
MDEREARWKKVSDHRVIDPNTFTDPTDRMAAIYARADRILGDKRFQSLSSMEDMSSTMVDKNPKGLVEAGNIPIWDRPNVKNFDGSSSTEFSISVGDDKGREILLPTVVDGKFLTPDGKIPSNYKDDNFLDSIQGKALAKAAWDHYEKTKENLGKFDNPADADAYAQRLHNRGKIATKEGVLSNYYDRYVAPGYRALGYDVPDKDLYIRGIQENKGKINSKDFYTAPSNLSRFLSSMGSEQASITRGLTYAGINVGSKVQQLQLLGLDKFFPHGQEYRDQVQKQTDVAKHIVDKVDNAIYDSPRFWLAAHPSRSWTDKMDTFVGENLVQLPLYEAIGTARVALVPGETLTAKLGTSKIGQFVGRRLMEASDGYVGALLQDKGKADRLGDAVSFAAFGAALEGAAIPSRFLIKQFTSRNVGVGGTLFQEAISDEAEHELTHEIHEPQFVTADPIKNKVVTAEKVTLSQMGKEKYGKAWNQLSQSQRTAIRTARDKITSEAASEAAIHNSDIAKMEVTQRVSEDAKSNPKLAQRIAEAEKASGFKVSDALFNSEQEAIKQQSGIKQSQGAVKNFGGSINLPPDLKGSKPRYGYGNKLFQLQFDDPRDLALYTIAQKTENKAHARFMNYLQKQFPDKSEAELKKMGEVVRNKIKGLAKDNDPAEGPLKIEASRPISNERTVHEIQPGSEEAQEQEPRKFAQFKTESLNYFINRAKASGPNLSTEIKDMDSEEFTESIQEQLGNFVKFENPEHALLWANQFRSDLPTAFSRRLTEELHELNPNETVKDWNEQSKNLSTHMGELAYVGRLFSQGNVFRSTRVDQWLDKTKWQDQLQGEVEAREMAVLKKKLARYPKIVQAAQKQLKTLQMLRAKTKDAGHYSEQTEKIRTMLEKKGKEWAAQL